MKKLIKFIYIFFIIGLESLGNMSAVTAVLEDNLMKKNKLVTQEDIIEMLFTGLINMTINPKTLQIEELEYQGTQTSVLSKKSFYTVLSYGYSSRVVSKALRGELNLGNDVMTSVILGLLLNNQLDSGTTSK